MADQPVEGGTPAIGAAPLPSTNDVPEQVAADAGAHRFVVPAPLDSFIALLWRRRGLLVGGTAAFLFLFLILALAQSLYGSSAWAYDFRAYYEAAQRLIVTGTPYQADTLAGPFLAGPSGLYLYTPVPVVVLLPLAYIPVTSAALVYLVVRLVMLVVMCAIMPISRTARLAVLGIACLSAPVIQDLNLGNASLIVTFFAVVAWRFMDRPAGAGAIAASITIRPTMALFGLWWLVRGRWKPVIWTVAVGLALFALTLPFVGIGGWLDYVQIIANLTAFEQVYRNFALGALAAQAGAPPWLAQAALYLGYAIAAGAVLLSLRRDRELSFVVTLGATLLLSPLLWDHYFTNLLVPAAFMAGRGRWWALLLPLLCWLPHEALPFIAIAGMLIPFAAPDRGPRARSVFDLLSIRRQPAPA